MDHEERCDDAISSPKSALSSRIRRQEALSPASSTSSASRHSRSSIVQALAAAQRRQRIGSPQGSDNGSLFSAGDTSALNLPSLQESRNDKLPIRLEPLLHVKSEDDNQEVQLKPRDDGEEKKSDTSGSASSKFTPIPDSSESTPPPAGPKSPPLLASETTPPLTLDDSSSNAETNQCQTSQDRKSIFLRTKINSPSDNTADADPQMDQSTQKIENALFPPESVGSTEDYEGLMQNLPSRLTESKKLTREKILQKIVGYATPTAGFLGSPRPLSTHFEEENTIQSSTTASSVTKRIKEVTPVVVRSLVAEEQGEEESAFGSWFNFLWGSDQEKQDEDPLAQRRTAQMEEDLPAMATSLVRVMSDPAAPSYVKAVNPKKIDPRMPEWIGNQFSVGEDIPLDGTYQLGKSRTVIVHEVQRGNWTWATEWSPDGDRLAVATDNHHLAVLDTSSSLVWRVKYDKKVTGPAKQGMSNSIRSIAWGRQFIAIGGVGNAVSILAPIEPYLILHTITPTGFVGSLDWLQDTNTLIIGSRLGKAMIVKMSAVDQDTSSVEARRNGGLESILIHTIDREKAWVNAVKFSPSGSAFAVGDSDGILGIYTYEDLPDTPTTVTNVANFQLEDSILDVEWSPDGKWLYAGGEDFVVTVISTQTWEAVHRIKRDLWVQFISSSHGGSHLAIGGVSSEVSVLDVNQGWDAAINISLKGLVPLSAKWHPQDQFLVLTGQHNSILAVETTNARYVSGHFLRSVSPILAIEFSPDGRMVVVGNEAGVVTIFKLSGTTFITAYELVLDCNGSLCINWSLNGAFVALAAGDKAVIVSRAISGEIGGNAPPNASGFAVANVIRDNGAINTVSIDPQSRYVAVSGSKTRIFDATLNFKCVQEMENVGITMANSWSPDGTYFATIGRNQNLTIYDTSSQDILQWQAVFSVESKRAGLALAWGPLQPGGRLQYCAYGGEDKEVYILELRNNERTWETVLAIPRAGIIYDLDWNNEGLVAAAIGNGTVTIMDLSYLQSGSPVNEMDYKWQRQALTCFTEIRRNRGTNRMKSARWLPSAPGSDNLLAVGGTDGELEIVDLTEKQRCSGFLKSPPLTEDLLVGDGL